MIATIFAFAVLFLMTVSVFFTAAILEHAGHMADRVRDEQALDLTARSQAEFTTEDVTWARRNGMTGTVIEA